MSNEINNGLTDSGMREKCVECGKSLIVYRVDVSEVRVKHFVQECECQKKDRIMAEETKVVIEKSNFSKKCERLFPFLECDQKIQEHTFEKFEVNEQNNAAFEETKKATFGYFSNYGINLTGSYGSGKTRLVKTLGYELYKKGEDVIFVEYAEIFDRIFSTYKPGAKESEIELMDCLFNVKNLIIDELGVGTNTPGKEDLFLKIINKRKKKGFKTNFTMNEEGKKQLSGRIVSRLVEYAKTVVNNAPDYRLKTVIHDIVKDEKRYKSEQKKALKA